MSRARALMVLRTLYAGWDFGIPLFQTGMATDRGKLKALKDRFLRVTYRSAFDLSEAILDRYLMEIDHRQIRFISGYAESLYLLSRRAQEVGFNRKMRAAISWASNLLAAYRTSIRDAFGCPTFDSYGVGEGMQIAAQSIHSGDLLHQFALHVAAEIVDPFGQPVSPGDRGEIVLTRLDAGAMPLIRYRVGDMGRAAPEPSLSGGIDLPLWQGIDGRVSDIIQTPSGNQLIVEFFFGIMQYAPTITLFQVEQIDIETLHFRIVVNNEFVADDWRRIERELLTKGDPELRITMEIVDDIPLGRSGKRHFNISRPDSR